MDGTNTEQICNAGGQELSCDSGQVLSIVEATCVRENCWLKKCSCAVVCFGNCDAKTTEVIELCQGKPSCLLPPNDEESTQSCQKNKVLEVEYGCVPAPTTTEQSLTTSDTSPFTHSTHTGSTPSKTLSTTTEWLSRSTNGRSTHEMNDDETVTETIGFADSTSSDRAKDSAPLDPKVIAGIAAAGIILLLLVALFIIVKRRNKKSTSYQKQTVAEEKHNELYGMNASYEGENGVRNPADYSIATAVAKDVGDTKTFKQNAYAYTDEADRDAPSQRILKENILYGER